MTMLHVLMVETRKKTEELFKNAYRDLFAMSWKSWRKWKATESKITSRMFECCARKVGRIWSTADCSVWSCTRKTWMFERIVSTVGITAAFRMLRRKCVTRAVAIWWTRSTMKLPCKRKKEERKRGRRKTEERKRGRGKRGREEEGRRKKRKRKRKRKRGRNIKEKKMEQHTFNR